MLLYELKLLQFRTYPKLQLSIPEGISCFVGDNAIGKTNIVEAVYALSTGKSFRADADREMIAWGSEIARIHGVTVEDTLEIMVTPGFVSGQKAPLKKYLVNGVSRRQADFVGKFPAVLFAPEHLLLVTGSPGMRRRFLDDVLCLVDRDYRRSLSSYEKGVRQRNKVLEAIQEGRATRSHLLFWDQLLIQEGGFITDKRTELIAFLNTFEIPGVLQKIEYDKSVISESRILQYKDAEVSAKATLVGPHRDDFSFIIVPESTHKKEGVSLKTYGSRGQQRLGVLWLKLAEMAFLEAKLQNRPILLLDDIFSELDREHDTLVTKLITGHQTIITSAEVETVAFLTGLGHKMTYFRLPFSGNEK